MTLLRTERLTMQPWLAKHLGALAMICEDKEVMKFFPRVLTREECRSLLEGFNDHFREYGYGVWAMVPHGGEAPIGFCGLKQVTMNAPFAPAVEILWRLNRAAWGWGFANEAARAALQHGFEKVGLEEIVSFTTPKNLRSIALMERLGMRRDPEEDFEHPALPEDDPLRPHVLYRLRREEWRRREA